MTEGARLLFAVDREGILRKFKEGERAARQHTKGYVTTPRKYPCKSPSEDGKKAKVLVGSF
ncbi:hypothetical protein AGMMS50229_09510 [Campylobacterota bacterium]|nr:hypothetical protein AGMMS50229_09510 [Campylobacterota bacterium]